MGACAMGGITITGSVGRHLVHTILEAAVLNFRNALTGKPGLSSSGADEGLREDRRRRAESGAVIHLG